MDFELAVHGKRLHQHWACGKTGASQWYSCHGNREGKKKKEEKAVGKQGRPFKGTCPPPVNYFFQ